MKLVSQDSVAEYPSIADIRQRATAKARSLLKDEEDKTLKECLDENRSLSGKLGHLKFKKTQVEDLLHDCYVMQELVESAIRSRSVMN